MAMLVNLTLESLRMLSFLTILGVGLLGAVSLTGCDKPASDPVPVTPDPDATENAPDTTEKKDIKIDAPGVDIEIDRTPDADGERGVDVDVIPGPAGQRGVDVDVDRE